MAGVDRGTAARKARLRALAECYKRKEIFGRHICTYCGDPADTWDHVPPVSWVYSEGPSWFSVRGYPLLLVPACKECNRWLGDAKLFTIRDRARKIRTKLITELDRVSGVDWNDDEIEELGYNLKTLVKASAYVIRGYTLRINWADNIASMTEDRYGVILDKLRVARI